MSEHAKLAPSAASRWMACPGSVALCKDIPDESSVYADEGTFAHEIASGSLLLDCNPFRASRALGLQPYLGVESECERFTVDEAMIAHLQLYIDAVRGTAELLCDEPIVEIEQRVVVVPDVLWGTADVLIWDDTNLHVFDLKYGAGVYVPVTGNSQAMLYALGALMSNPMRAHNVRRIYLHIVQPRHHADPKWRTDWTMKMALESWFQTTVLPKIQAIQLDTDTELVAGETQCRFCPAKGTCPELRKTALEHTQAVFEDRQPPSPDMLTPADLGKTMEVFPLIEEWMSAVRKHAYELVEKKRTPIPGFKLVRKTGNRKWNNETASTTELLLRGVDPYAKQKLISPAEAERRLGKHKSAVADLAYVPDAGTALVPDDDHRQAWTPGEVFPLLTDKES